jgi:hypothetical protein
VVKVSSIEQGYFLPFTDRLQAFSDIARGLDELTARMAQ